MTIETKELVISEELKRKVEMICRFAYVDYEFINGNIKSIKNTNIAYVKPHILKVKNNDYLIFEEYEKTPHIHCVVIPLIRKYDKRTDAEKYTISKKQYIKDKAHLSELQDKYYQRLIDKGFYPERGIKNRDNEHIGQSKQVQQSTLLLLISVEQIA